MTNRLVVLAACVLATVSVAGQEQPRFRTGVEVTALDAGVVDQSGQPITDLTAQDFAVRVDNVQRRIVSAEWISSTTARMAMPIPVPEGYSSNESIGGGRLILLAFDEANLRFGGGRAVLAAATRFIDALPPGDRIAAVGIGVAAPAVGFTTNRKLVKDTIGRMTGRADSPLLSDHRMSLGEATAIEQGDQVALDAVVRRECPPRDQLCVQEVQQDAISLAMANRQRGQQFVQGLRDVLTALRSIDAPKTIVLMSNGFVADDSTGEAADLATAAAAARTSLYVLRLDRSFVDMSDHRAAVDPFGDDRERSRGLEMLAGMARGALFVVTGAGETVFKRIASELAGYYLIGLESDPRDRDGKAHQVRIEVTRRGAIVRARQQFVEHQAARAAAANPQQALAAAMANPLPMPGLPMRVIAFSLRGPERDKVQLLIHAEIGNAYMTPTAVSAGFTLTDTTGRVVDTRVARANLETALPGAPSALIYVAGASVAPGDYTLKVAAADGERAGSVEHPVHAMVSDDGPVALSDFVAGSSISARPQARPAISSTAWYGTMQGYLESYGPASSGVSVRYEVAVDDEQPPLTAVAANARPAGDERTIHTALVPVAMLPPGTYRLRAIVTLPGGASRRLSRSFAVPSRLPSPAPALADEQPGADGGEAASRVNLSVSESLLQTPFNIDSVLSVSTINELLDHWIPEPAPSAETIGYLRAARSGSLRAVPPTPKDDNPFAWFVRGLAYLQSGEHASAEENLKKALTDETDATVPLVYLGATYAVTGHDQQAAAAWVTALAQSDDLPAMYEWAAGALMRIRDVAQARDLLEEAVAKWPDDVRFARPLAYLYATLGRGRQAITQLERHLTASPDDKDALMLGVRWYYELHAAGESAHDDDAARAKRYAEAYEKLGGTELPLVKQWVAFLSRP